MYMIREHNIIKWNIKHIHNNINNIQMYIVENQSISPKIIGICLKTPKFKEYGKDLTIN